MAPQGPKMLNTANRALWWVPSIANLNAIKKTEVDAGINITCRVTAANFQFGITGNASITDPGLCAQIETSAPGLATVAAEMDFFRFKNDVDDVAWTTFDGKDISGYLVQRIGQIGDDEDQENTPVKVGDELQAGEFLTHDQQILSPATAGYEKFKQVFAPQAYVQRSIVVA